MNERETIIRVIADLTYIANTLVDGHQTAVRDAILRNVETLRSVIRPNKDTR